MAAPAGLLPCGRRNGLCSTPFLAPHPALPLCPVRHTTHSPSLLLRPAACLCAEYAQVLRMLGNGRLEAYCMDGVKRLCHIRGKMRKKVSGVVCRVQGG